MKKVKIVNLLSVLELKILHNTLLNLCDRSVTQGGESSASCRVLGVGGVHSPPGVGGPGDPTHPRLTSETP